MSIEKITRYCNQYNIQNYIINDDLTVDVKGSVALDSCRLVKIPLSFNYVSGDFYCGYNKLTSLKCCPTYVGGDFYCQYSGIAHAIL